MTKYKWLLIFSALVAGGLLAWWLHRPPPVVAPIVQEMMHEVEALEQRVNALDQRVRKEVGKIREDVKQEISTLTRDDVADALNAELAEFRRLDVPSGGVVNF